MSVHPERLERPRTRIHLVHMPLTHQAKFIVDGFFNPSSHLTCSHSLASILRFSKFLKPKTQQQQQQVKRKNFQSGVNWEPVTEQISVVLLWILTGLWEGRFLHREAGDWGVERSSSDGSFQNVPQSHMTAAEKKKKLGVKANRFRVFYKGRTTDGNQSVREVHEPLRVPSG